MLRNSGQVMNWQLPICSASKPIMDSCLSTRIKSQWEPYLCALQQPIHQLLLLAHLILPLIFSTTFNGLIFNNIALVTSNYGTSLAIIVATSVLVISSTWVPHHVPLLHLYPNMITTYLILIHPCLWKLTCLVVMLEKLQSIFQVMFMLQPPHWQPLEMLSNRHLAQDCLPHYLHHLTELGKTFYYHLCHSIEDWLSGKALQEFHFWYYLCI